MNLTIKNVFSNYFEIIELFKNLQYTLFTYKTIKPNEFHFISNDKSYFRKFRKSNKIKIKTTGIQMNNFP